MMNPADHPQLTSSQRPAESPTLWLSLALGSVLIHLVLFILASIVSTQTARVQVDPEPIAVEFVEPARSAAAGRAIAVNPGKPSPRKPSDTQAQNRLARSQPPRFNQPAEQPVVPREPVKPVPARSPQPNLARPASPQPSSSPTQPQASSTASQSGSPGTSSQGGSPDTSSGNGTQPSSEPQQPATSTTKIAEPLQRRDVLVEVLKSYEKGEFHPKKASIQSPIRASILESPLIAQELRQGIAVKVTLDIAENGFSSVIDTLPNAANNTLDRATLDTLAHQIFTDLQFEPAQYDPGGLSVKPRRSDLIIEARIRLP